MIPKLLILSVLLVQPLLAFAAGENAPGVDSGTLAQAFFGLLFIVALLAGTAWFARKISGGQGFGQGGMRVVGGVALGPRERIVLVEVDETWLVIGIVPGQIRTLHRLPKGALPDGHAMAGNQPFAQWLKNVLEKRGNGA